MTRVAVGCGGASGTSVVKGCLGPGKGLVRVRHTLRTTQLSIPAPREKINKIFDRHGRLRPPIMVVGAGWGGRFFVIRKYAIRE